MTGRATGRVSGAQAVAYRVAAHNLHEHRRLDDLLGVVAVAPVRDTPPGSGGVALAARVAKLTPAHIETALLDDRTLLRMLSLRGAAHLVSRRDGAVFGPGTLAADEDSLREQLGSAWTAVAGPGWTATEALGSVVGVLTTALADAEPRTKGQLSEALHDRVPPELEPWCEPCDVHHVPDQLLRLAGTAGAYCYGWPQGRRQMLMSTDIWLGGPLGGDVRRARVELARRFVHAYAPVSPRHLATWTGIAPVDARRRFEALGAELAEVRLDGATAFALADDLELLSDPPLASGARLLPSGDPFLAQADRSTLLPDKAQQRAAWRPTRGPGLVLLTGHPVGLWQARTRGGRLHVTVEAFTSLSERQRTAVDQAADRVAPFRGCEAAEVEFTGAA